MKTKKKLNCRMFTNLIVSLFVCNFLTTTEPIQYNNINSKIVDFKLDLTNIKEQVAKALTNEITILNVSKQEVFSGNSIPYKKPTYNAVTGTNLVNYAKYYLGLPYVSGGYSLSTGTDCSGFTKLIFKEFGINLGRTVKSQIYNGTYVSKSDLQPGDLVFYGYTSNNPTHVGIYMGNGLVIHESNPRDGVKINSVNMMVYITARRLITESVFKEVPLPNEKVEDKTDAKPESNNNSSLKEENKTEENTSVKEENKEVLEDIKEENKLEDTKKEETNTSNKEESKQEEKNPVNQENSTSEKEEVNKNSSTSDSKNSVKEEVKEDIKVEEKNETNLESDTSI